MWQTHLSGIAGSPNKGLGPLILLLLSFADATLLVVWPLPDLISDWGGKEVRAIDSDCWCERRRQVVTHC